MRVVGGGEVTPGSLSRLVQTSMTGLYSWNYPVCSWCELAGKDGTACMEQAFEQLVQSVYIAKQEGICQSYL